MSDDGPQKSGEVSVYYQNSGVHRTLFVGGAWAGITPSGLVQLALFNDLHPMPEMVTHGIINDEMGPEKEKLERRGVVREVEATLVMPLPIAKSLIPLIQQMIDQLEALQAKHQAQSDKAS